MFSRAFPAALVATLAGCGVLGCSALADETAPDNVIVARSGSAPLLVWDASSTVADIVQKNVPRDQALHDVEAHALGIVAGKAKDLNDANAISIRVIYEKTGAVSPRYGTATLDAVEKLFTLTAPRASVLKSASNLESELSKGKVPGGVTVEMSGQLPPP